MRERILGRHRADLNGLRVRRIPAGRTRHERVLTARRDGEELLALTPTHRAADRADDPIVESETIEDPLVRRSVEQVAALESGIVDVERVAVLHHELAATEHT